MVILHYENIMNPDGFHIAETILRGDMLTFQHTHDFYEIFLITAGCVSQLVNGAEIVMGEDSLGMAGPGDIHRFQRKGSQAAHFINIAFTPEIFRWVTALYRQYGEAWDESDTVRMVQLPSGLGQALQAKAALLNKNTAQWLQLPVKEVLTGILLDCLCFLYNKDMTNVSRPAWLLAVCEAMRQEENYLQGLPRFVALSGKSQEHLTRSMKHYCHITPSAYLNGIKLERVAVLLKTTERTVLDILLQCGFNNVSHFNRLFREKYGVTPVRYRYLNRVVIDPAEGGA